MSLFDGQAERAAEPRKKVEAIHKRKHSTNNEALVDDRYGTGSRSSTKTVAANRTKQERNEITKAYEKGELKFEDTSRAFLLCHCCMYPDFHSFPHDPHSGEIATFELEHYGRKRKI